MKRLLKIFAFVIPGTFAQQLQPVAGSISGNLRGDDGSAISGGIIILHREPTEKSRMARQRTDWSTVTAATGVFQFAGLPEGNYSLCPHVQNSIWLNPCQWNLQTPTATISRLSPNASVTIVLKRGAAVPFESKMPVSCWANTREERRCGIASELRAQAPSSTPCRSYLKTQMGEITRSWSRSTHSSPSLFIHPSIV